MVKLNGKLIEPKYFPNGEVMLEKKQIDKILGKRDYSIVEISFKYINDKDFFFLKLLKDYLESANYLYCTTTLEIMYMPYSRMDRENEYYSFSLETASKIIDECDFDEVYINEPHSMKTLDLIQFSVVNDLTLFLYGHYLEDFYDNILCFPDEGAKERYTHSDTYNLESITAKKERDFKTGRITNLTLDGPQDLAGQTVVILDDLCSKGGTFMWTAQELKKRGAGKIILIVAHCEETIFEGEILKTDLIDQVYTTNTILENSKGFVKLHVYPQW